MSNLPVEINDFAIQVEKKTGNARWPTNTMDQMKEQTSQHNGGQDLVVMEETGTQKRGSTEPKTKEARVV